MNRGTCYFVLLSLVMPTAWANADILVPGDLQPGDTYHLAFVTRGVEKGSRSVIGFYNDFVQDEAALNSALTGTDEGVTWKAIASTETVAANTNAVDTAPVYLMDGVTMIRGEGDSLYDGTGLLAPLQIDQYGDLIPSGGLDNAWTGSDAFGNPHRYYYYGNWYDNFLGCDRGHAKLGRPAVSTDWLYSAYSADTWRQYHFYALSEELTAPVPEPSDLVALAGLFAMGLIGYCCRRRRLSFPRSARPCETTSPLSSQEHT
jgi:hypothetical protein